MSDEQSKEPKGWREILDDLRKRTVLGSIFYPEYEYQDIDDLEDKLFHDE